MKQIGQSPRKKNIIPDAGIAYCYYVCFYFHVKITEEAAKRLQHVFQLLTILWIL